VVLVTTREALVGGILVENVCKIPVLCVGLLGREAPHLASGVCVFRIPLG